MAAGGALRATQAAGQQQTRLHVEVRRTKAHRQIISRTEETEVASRTLQRLDCAPNWAHGSCWALPRAQSRALVVHFRAITIPPNLAEVRVGFIVGRPRWEPLKGTCEHRRDVSVVRLGAAGRPRTVGGVDVQLLALLTGDVVAKGRRQRIMHNATTILDEYCITAWGHILPEESAIGEEDAGDIPAGRGCHKEPAASTASGALCDF